MQSLPKLRLRAAPRAAGFTLIELMVAVTIIAILAAIAYPSYRNYVLRGQLVSATNGLSALQANMERYFQDNRTYASTGTFTSPCLVATPIVNGTFTLSCTAAVPPTLTTYQLQAVGSASTNGFSFFVNQTNTQWSTVSGVSGWQNCTTGWGTKPGAC